VSTITPIEITIGTSQNCSAASGALPDLLV
jgi:hypothetical protein